MESFFGTQLRGDWQNAELFKMMVFSANYTSEVTKLQGFSKFSNLSRELSFGTSLVYKEHMKSRCGPPAEPEGSARVPEIGRAHV